MGRYYWRPNFAASVDYGNVDTDGSGPVLGDNNDNTGKKYFSDAGSILSFNLPSATVIPTGRDIIAVRVGHRQKNAVLLFNGWVRSYLRYDGKRQSNTIAYKQDGYSTSTREVLGTALYNQNLDPWPWEEIAKMAAETGAHDGEIGPNKNNRWCYATEVFIQLVYNDPVPVPTDVYPANGATIDTSSVQFSAKAPASQEEQPVKTVFQVCRVNTFDNDDVRTFIGGLNSSTDPASRSYYVSDPLKDSYTNLGPGTWYVRIKNRDYRDAESAWGATSSFTIVHGPLPGATLVDPTSGATVTSPYRVRTGRISAAIPGGRKAGITWQFSKASDFSSGVVQWTNTADGTFTAASDFPVDVSYDPTPNALTQSGLQGNTVGAADPPQYLSQGTWYGRVRVTDVWGQYGPWSTALSFSVSHPPVPSNLIPTGGASFDQAEGPVRWTFTDPWSNDYQTAYQMVVRDSSNNVLQTIAKTTSGLSKATMNVPNTYLRQVLTIGIEVWDADDVKNLTPNVLVGTCRLSKAPVTTIIFPSADGVQINSGQPNFQWSSVFAAAGIVQQSFAIVIKESDTGKVVYDSGTITGTAVNHLPTRPILKNLKGYQMALTITDSENLGKTVYRNFATNFDRPETVYCDVDTSGYAEYGAVEITWPTGNPDPYFKEWRIYRKPAVEDDDAYVLAGVVENSEIKSFQDWLIAGNDNFVYTVVQVAYRYGSLVESLYNPTNTFFISSESYWLIIPTNPNLNVKLHTVTGDSFTDNREMADYNIIGGGRRRAYGTKYGIAGDLSIAVRHNQNMTASQFIKALRNVCYDQYSLYLRDPFGNVTLIALGEMTVDRLAGVGSSEFADVGLPYIEVGPGDVTDTPVVVGGEMFVESPPGSGLFSVIQLQGSN